RQGGQSLCNKSLPYPLPWDLNEIHRQILRTMLLCSVFNGPVCSPNLNTNPPRRVLEVGCGSGFWSITCYHHFARRGLTSISYTGLDIAPLAPSMDWDEDMDWRFVQHDLRQLPLPFHNEEFDMIMTKDLSMAISETVCKQKIIDEYLRILKVGGTWETWDGDHCLRTLLPCSSDENNRRKEEKDRYQTGAYPLTTGTRLEDAQNKYIRDYNSWVSKAMESRSLTITPWAQIRSLLLQETEILYDVDCRRLVIPLSEMLWESKAKATTKSKYPRSNYLTTTETAIRRTALMSFVQIIASLQPVLREASGKNPSEWDHWYDSMIDDLLNNAGTARGECLEVCAAWARKR
ncbi:hypothetical protein OIDMADRAFT_66364, partial [Oidiodendron maius Zn]